MERSIYEYKNYKSYLTDQFGGPKQRTGRRLAASRFLDCHPTHISQVLKDKAELSLEQAFQLNKFLDHSADESHFFVLLVQKSRAGTVELIKYFEDQIQTEREAQLEIKNRVGKTSKLQTELDEVEFFSHWLNLAIAVLISIPDLNTKTKLATSLRVSEAHLDSVLRLLQRLGLVDVQQELIVVGPESIHLDSDSKVIAKHHLNWRLKAMESITSYKTKGSHYSGVFTVSEEDALKLKSNILNLLEENQKIIANSTPEKCYVFNFDFFDLLKS